MGHLSTVKEETLFRLKLITNRIRGKSSTKWVKAGSTKYPAASLSNQAVRMRYWTAVSRLCCSSGSSVKINLSYGGAKQSGHNGVHCKVCMIFQGKYTRSHLLLFNEFNLIQRWRHLLCKCSVRSMSSSWKVEVMTAVQIFWVIREICRDAEPIK